jgi:hypothetical protein
MTKEQKEGWAKCAEIMEDYNLEISFFYTCRGLMSFEITGSDGTFENDTLCADDILYICNAS